MYPFIPPGDRPSYDLSPPGMSFPPPPPDVIVLHNVLWSQRPEKCYEVGEHNMVSRDGKLNVEGEGFDVQNYLSPRVFCF